MTPSRQQVTLTIAVSVVVSLVAVVGWWAEGGATSAAFSVVTAPPDPHTSPTQSDSTDQQANASDQPETDTMDAQASQRSAREAALTTTLAQLTQSTGVDFAIAVVDHTSATTFTFNGDATFETASVVKVEILAALLLQNDGTLNASQKQLADIMIRQSDNDAASALWRQIGDVQGLAEASSVLGLTDTVPGTGGWWSLTTTTVADQARLVDSIVAPNGPLGIQPDHH